MSGAARKEREDLTNLGCSVGSFDDDFRGTRKLQSVAYNATFGEVEDDLDGVVRGFRAKLVELEEGIGHQGEDASILAEVEVDLRAGAGAGLIAGGEGVAGAGAFPLAGLLTADLGVAGDGADGGATGGRSIGGGLAAEEKKREKKNECSHI